MEYLKFARCAILVILLLYVDYGFSSSQWVGNKCPLLFPFFVISYHVRPYMFKVRFIYVVEWLEKVVCIELNPKNIISYVSEEWKIPHPTTTLHLPYVRTYLSTFWNSTCISLKYS